MARISKGKFRHLRQTYMAQKYFTITKKNIEQMKRMLGDHIQIGEQYVMRPMPMTPELRAALEGSKGQLFDDNARRRLLKNLPLRTKALLERKSGFVE